MHQELPLSLITFFPINLEQHAFSDPGLEKVEPQHLHISGRIVSTSQWLELLRHQFQGNSAQAQFHDILVYYLHYNTAYYSRLLL